MGQKTQSNLEFSFLSPDLASQQTHASRLSELEKFKSLPPKHKNFKGENQRSTVWLHTSFNLMPQMPIIIQRKRVIPED